MARAKGFTMRSVRNWGNYVWKSMRLASARRFDRLYKRAEVKKSQRRSDELLRAIEKVAKQKKGGAPSIFEVDVIARIVSDTALKNVGVSEEISAKEYPKLVRATRKFVRASAIPSKSELALQEAEKEIDRICGPLMRYKILKEIDGLMAIISEWGE